MKLSYTLTLSDGSKLENLQLNGNNFLSETEVTPATFAGKLSEVRITASSTPTEPLPYPETMHDAELVQITPASETPDGRWWFILREIPEEERYRKEMEQKNEMLTQCLLEISEIVYA